MVSFPKSSHISLSSGSIKCISKKQCSSTYYTTLPEECLLPSYWCWLTEAIRLLLLMKPGSAPWTVPKPYPILTGCKHEFHTCMMPAMRTVVVSIGVRSCLYKFTEYLELHISIHWTCSHGMIWMRWVFVCCDNHH